ncbi:ornithine carbamoyltransferase [Anaerolineales bacterium]
MKHFLQLYDWSADDLWHMLQMAVHLKMEWQSGGNRPILKNKILGMVFQKPSLRTRVSFEVAMQHLGGSALMLGPQEIGLGKRESIADVSRVLSGYVQCIMARVFDHQHVLDLAEYSRVPVINGLSDSTHPCQAMADMLTIYEKFGQLEGLKLTFVGDGNNVAASLAYACAHFGMEFVLAAPDAYRLPDEVVQRANKIGEDRSVEIQQTSSVEEAVEDSDIIYTDTWVSMGQEDEVAARLKEFQPYQVNAGVVQLASPDAIVMHCLPAHRGEEITDDVADGVHSAIFQQAENRLHAQKAILVKLLS